MEIEKINENQIKFMLNKTDLEERDIQISDLSYGSEKSQELFQEIMEEAVLHCDFRAEGHVPLVVEAVPMANESLMIIVTKTSGRGAHDTRYDLMPRTKNEDMFIEKALDSAIQDAEAHKAEEAHGSNLAVYVFDSLDDTASAAARAAYVFNGTSALYKNAGRFYLVLQYAPSGKGASQLMDFALNDYGQKHSTSPMAKTYLAEHGELLIPGDAVQKLASL